MREDTRQTLAETIQLVASIIFADRIRTVSYDNAQFYVMDWKTKTRP